MPGADTDLQLSYDPLPADALIRFVSDNVINVNFAKTGSSAWHPANFFLKNLRGECLGGVLGYVWGGWLHVNFLWITEHLRGQGLGTRLMNEVEAFSRERGAFAATLETFTMQAPDFYAKRGYTICGRLDDYPPGQAKLILSKRLVA
jgi:GNAT superfamily N-acetyltransferase